VLRKGGRGNRGGATKLRKWAGRGAKGKGKEGQNGGGGGGEGSCKRPPIG